MKPLFDLTKKTAIVTGGGKGIGKAVSERLAYQGAHVFILDIDKNSASETASQIANEGRQATFIYCDVADHKQVEDSFKQVWETTGRLNILVNNAAIAHIGNVEDTTPEDMDRLYNINIKSVYNCLHHGVKLMKKSGGGAIVNMASVASVIGVADRFAYSTTKGAVMTMTYSIAKDYIKDNIRCNAVAPARVHTPFVDGYLAENYPGEEMEMFEKLSQTQPIGRMGKPSEISNLVLYLCSAEAGFITGSVYPIDGGFLTLNT